MKKCIYFLLSICFILSGCFSSEAKTQVDLTKEKVTFVAIVDGDTAKFKVKKKVESVRFLLIDTPETAHPKLGKQPLGEEAKIFTNELLSNAKEVILEWDAEKRDKYHRLLAHVYVDGKSVQKALLEEGLARVGYIYESKKHLEEYQQAEEIAEEAERGIWQCPGYATDHGFVPEKWCK
jgi:micrococcal nuclease